MNQTNEQPGPESGATLPCPFCGSYNISDGENLIESEALGVGRVTCKQSECLNCGACGPLSQPVKGPDYGDVAAIAAWNRRAPTPPVVPHEASGEVVERVAMELAGRDDGWDDDDTEESHQAREEYRHEARRLIAAVTAALAAAPSPPPARAIGGEAALRDALNVCLGHLTGGLDGDWRDCDPVALARDVLAATPPNDPPRGDEGAFDPATVEGMSVSIDVSTGDEDAHHRYFGKVTEAMRSLDHNGKPTKHGVVLLVQDSVESNFTTTPSALIDEAVVGQENSLVARLKGRAAFLRGLGHVKSPGLMEHAATALEAAGLAGGPLCDDCRQPPGPILYCAQCMEDRADRKSADGYRRGREAHPESAARQEAVNYTKLDTQLWGVDIRIGGVQVLSIENECYGGIENIADYREVVLRCADHLRAFIGTDEADAAFAFDPYETTPHPSPAQSESASASGKGHE